MPTLTPFQPPLAAFSRLHLGILRTTGGRVSSSTSPVFAAPAKSLKSAGHVFDEARATDVVGIDIHQDLLINDDDRMTFPDTTTRLGLPCRNLKQSQGNLLPLMGLLMWPFGDVMLMWPFADRYVNLDPLQFPGK